MKARGVASPEGPDGCRGSVLIRRPESCVGEEAAVRVTFRGEHELVGARGREEEVSAADERRVLVPAVDSAIAQAPEAGLVLEEPPDADAREHGDEQYGASAVAEDWSALQRPVGGQVVVGVGTLVHALPS